jgi:hypothetical protein
LPVRPNHRPALSRVEREGRRVVEREGRRVCLRRVVLFGELFLSAAVKMSSWCRGGGGKRGGEEEEKRLGTDRRLVSAALPGGKAGDR